MVQESGQRLLQLPSHQKSRLRSIGGFNEELSVAYNDVDLCWRLLAENFAVVVTPFPKLFMLNPKVVVKILLETSVTDLLGIRISKESILNFS